MHLRPSLDARHAPFSNAPPDSGSWHGTLTAITPRRVLPGLGASHLACVECHGLLPPLRLLVRAFLSHHIPTWCTRCEHLSTSCLALYPPPRLLILLPKSLPALPAPSNTLLSPFLDVSRLVSPARAAEPAATAGAHAAMLLLLRHTHDTLRAVQRDTAAALRGPLPGEEGGSEGDGGSSVAMEASGQVGSLD